MNDLFDALDKEEETPPTTGYTEKKEYKQDGGGHKGKKKESLYDAEITAKAVNKDGLKRFNRMVTIASSGPVDEKTILLIPKIVRALVDKGFTVRYNGDQRDTLGIEAYKAAEGSSEVYLAWSKINPDLVETAVLKKPELCGYEHAAHYNNFERIPAPIRAILSANIHSLLGARCDTPSNLFITFTPDGAETLQDANWDKDKTGRMHSYIKTCEDLAIPVFNLKNDDAPANIKNFIEALS